VRDRTTITRFLDGMEKKDLLRRETDPKDRRRARVVLTENAKALQGPLSAIAKDLIDRAQQGMSEQDANQLVTLLQKMTNNLLS
jgi:DNA-binding MarR family transcriptional regulator